MKINSQFFNAINNQKHFSEYRILNMEMRDFKGISLGELLDGNARKIIKIVKAFGLEMEEEAIAMWIGRWIKKNYFESI
jgi:hypothetical protein